MIFPPPPRSFLTASRGRVRRTAGGSLSPARIREDVGEVTIPWKRDVALKGFDLGDGQPALLDLRFCRRHPIICKIIG